MADDTTTNGNAPPQDWARDFLEGINKLNDNFTDFKSKALAPPMEPDDELDDDPAPAALPALPNFDDMSQTEVANWLMNHFGTTVVSSIIAQVQKAIQPLMEAQQQTATATLEEKYTREIETIVAEKDDKGKPVRPDFQDWNSQMIDIVRELPGINPVDAYNMARTRNPKRAAELDTKYNPPPPPPKSPFSFAPSGGGNSASDKGTKPLSNTEAFQSALNKVKEKWGDQYALGQREV